MGIKTVKLQPESTGDPEKLNCTVNLQAFVFAAYYPTVTSEFKYIWLQLPQEGIRKKKIKIKRVIKNNGYMLCSILVMEISLFVDNLVFQDTFATISLLLLCSPSLSYLVQ